MKSHGKKKEIIPNSVVEDMVAGKPQATSILRKLSALT
jgi:hypothetical protein